MQCNAKQYTQDPIGELEKVRFFMAFAQKFPAIGQLCCLLCVLKPIEQLQHAKAVEQMALQSPQSQAAPAAAPAVDVSARKLRLTLYGLMSRIALYAAFILLALLCGVCLVFVLSCVPLISGHSGLFSHTHIHRLHIDQIAEVLVWNLTVRMPFGVFCIISLSPPYPHLFPSSSVFCISLLLQDHSAAFSPLSLAPCFPSFSLCC